jgi:hypothetical protein
MEITNHHQLHASRVNWEEAHADIDHTPDNDAPIWDSAWWSTQRHIYAYAIIISCLLVLILSRSFAFYRMCLRVSMHLHDRLFRGVTRATMWFFNQNSTGRILNRFSKDIGTIDSMLPVVIVDCVQARICLIEHATPKRQIYELEGFSPCSSTYNSQPSLQLLPS